MILLLATIAASRRRASVAYDADAQAYFTAVEAVSTIGTIAKNAANALIVGLKADGLWTLIHQLYLYAGPDTLNGALIKAKGSGTRINNGFVSGDFSPIFGLQGGGAKYIKNGFLASALSGNSHSLFFYGSGYPLSGDNGLAGVWTGSAVSLMAFDSYSTAAGGRAYRSGTYDFASSPKITTAMGLTASGSLIAVRASTISSKIYQNGVSAGSSTAVVSPSPPALDFWSFAFNNNNATPTTASPDRRQVEAYAAGITDAQALQLHNRTATYITALNA